MFDFFASQHGKRTNDGEGCPPPHLATRNNKQPHIFLFFTHSGATIKNTVDRYFANINVTIIDLNKLVELLTQLLSTPKDDPDKFNSPTERHFIHQPGPPLPPKRN